MRKAYQRQCEIAEMRRLYEDEEWTLREIADKFGFKFQSVHYRLEAEGVNLRSKGPRQQRQFERELLEKLHIIDLLPVYKVAEQLNSSFNTILSELKRHGITHRRYRQKKYSDMDNLKIGESILVVPTKAIKPHLKFYSAAKIRGIKRKQFMESANKNPPARHR